ncbi:MAG: primosomal protein N' [Clostridiales bacterium]|jgi:primosomal protein N' (replication factor Y)|nr:primosomal protein N' [Clostridiales bacterium]
MLYASVIISSPAKEIDRVFTYKMPDGMKIGPGFRVAVPFGKSNARREGYIISEAETAGLPDDKIKSVLEPLDDYPVISPDMLELAFFMRGKYFSTLSSCLSCVIPYGIKLRRGLARTKKYVSLGDAPPKTDAQKRVTALLKESGGGAFADELRMRLSISPSVVGNMISKGMLTPEERAVRREVTPKPPGAPVPPFELNSGQRAALDFITGKTLAGNLRPTLLYGVTGSGKTEVYMRLIDAALRAGKSAVMLVPEISLTPQTVSVFLGRFGEKVAVTHSRLSAGERFDQWERAREGEVSVMIGPRSALFAPFSNVGCVIIDEEHEHSYKSELSPKYHAREIARFICEKKGAQLVLGSATPSLETYFAAKNGEIDLVELSERVNRKMPEVFIRDMRLELASGNASIFSRDLSKAIAGALARKEQAILFLNRRGHSTFVSCRKCGEALGCADCNVNYTYHLYANRLMCHYCGKTEQIPQNCPVCGSKYIKYFGAGTQKVEAALREAFPEARVLRMDADTTSRKNAHEEILSAFRRREADILIGTQMIAKGLDYPNVTLVGVVCADISLNIGDFRGAEETFQLLTQAAGRAGRAELPGTVYIQAYNPEHYAVSYAKNHDYAGFYAHETAARAQMGYPPYAFLFEVLFTGPDERKIISLLHKLAEIMRRYNKNGLFELVGPSAAIVSKIKGNYRHKLIIKSKDEEKLTAFTLFCAEKLRKYENFDGVMVSLTPNPMRIH